MGLMQELIQVSYLSRESVMACLKAAARKKQDEILSNLDGNVSVPQRQLLKMQLEHLKDCRRISRKWKITSTGTFPSLKDRSNYWNWTEIFLRYL